MYKNLRIYFGEAGKFVLDFALESSPITALWIERMQQRNQWPLDDPKRFYGFNSRQEEEKQALESVKQCIATINSYRPIIERDLVDVHDQDTLNYLHHIFEVYHGLLDQQDTEWWNAAPEKVQQALAQLNIAVHRCEACRKLMPRFVCTWFGMPKIKKLTPELIQEYGKEKIEFGAVYLNYVEIGKTAMELAIDNDEYIFDTAFKPFEHYSADFVVYFYENTDAEIAERRKLLEQYYQQHRQFFQKLGINSTNDYRIRPARFKVAQLQNQNKHEIINQLQMNQSIANIELI